MHDAFAWIYMKFSRSHTFKSLLRNIVFMYVHWSVLDKNYSEHSTCICSLYNIPMKLILSLVLFYN